MPRANHDQRDWCVDGGDDQAQRAKREQFEQTHTAGERYSSDRLGRSFTSRRRLVDSFINEPSILFRGPWEGRVNIGTTDTDYNGDKDHPRAAHEEINEILGAINSYFPEARLDRDDIISTWAGLRPLITDPRASNTAEVSRKEEIIESENGLISIGGGKLTTYRLMAERGIDLAVSRLKEGFNISARSATTENVAIGGNLSLAELTMIAERLSRNEDMPIETARHLLHDYGSDYQRLIELTHEDERLRELLIKGLPQILAEIVYAARYEMALTLADAMIRRTRLAILAGREALKCAASVAGLMARELGWSSEETERQIAMFTDEFEREFTVSAQIGR